MDDLLTVKEVCAWLKVNRNLVYDAIKSGALKAHRFGRAVRLRREDVLAWGRANGPEKTGV